MPARWVQRHAVCGKTQQHPLCRIPAAEGNWQLVPHACYYRGWSEAELGKALGNTSLLFVGDSTQRFLWGAFGNLLESDDARRFSQDGYGAQVSPRLAKGRFDACDRYGLSVLRVGAATITYTQLLLHEALRRSGGPGTSYEKSTDTFRVTKRGSTCTVIVKETWRALSQYVRHTRIDAVLLQVPTLERACNGGGGEYSRDDTSNATEAAADVAMARVASSEPALNEFVPMLRAAHPDAALSRRDITGWSAPSVPSTHCLRRDRLEHLEAALRAAPRPKPFGADEASWHRFTSKPFEMYRDTAAIHLVEPSQGVHVTRGVNTVFAHVLATHLMGVLRPRAR